MSLTNTKKKAELESLAADIRKSFGAEAAAVGGLQRELKTIPTGSLALDYELGIGGWPMGKLVGVFGPRDIGKSSMVGLNAVKSAQKMGLYVAWVALEPFSEEWARKNGVDPDEMLIAYPTTGEEAFATALKCIQSGVVDLLVFDSIGAVISEGEMAEDGKPRMGGQAGLITWFVKAAAPVAWRNEVCVILINQTRESIGHGKFPGQVHQPGGKALEFMESVIVQLKHGKAKYTIKDAGTDVIIGSEIVAHIIRNKESEGTGRKAVFDYFFMETDDYPFGIDSFSDVLNTAKRTGVIKQAGSYYDLPNGERFQGLKKVAEYLSENPEELAAIREGVLQKMLDRDAKPIFEMVEEAESA